MCAPKNDLFYYNLKRCKIGSKYISILLWVCKSYMEQAENNKIELVYIKTEPTQNFVLRAQS